MILGLTGGIGSGKSTAAGIFAELGWKVSSADDVLKREIMPRAEVAGAIAERFGSRVRAPDGTIDRAALGQIVFSDAEALQWLENLLHPRLYAHWRAIIAEQPQANWVLEVPLLFEKGLEIWFDFTVCVATTSANQIARLAERGLSPALAEHRISKQLPLAQKIESADFVISNDGSLEFLRDEIARLVEKLRVRL